MDRKMMCLYGVMMIMPLMVMVIHKQKELTIDQNEVEVISQIQDVTIPVEEVCIEPVCVAELLDVDNCTVDVSCDLDIDSVIPEENVNIVAMCNPYHEDVCDQEVSKGCNFNGHRLSWKNRKKRLGILKLGLMNLSDFLVSNV
jgi:hypothetical protein